MSSKSSSRGSGLSRGLVVMVALGFAIVAFAYGRKIASRARSKPLPPGPHLEIDRTEVNFGSVPHGAIVKQSYRLKNAGDAPLEILQVQTSCGCTSAAPSLRTIPPGETSVIELAFDTQKKSQKSERQKYINHALVVTNATPVGDVRLVLEGEVVSRFALVPTSGAVFPKPYVLGSEADRPEVEVTIRPRTKTDAVLGAVRILESPPDVEVDPPRLMKSGAVRIVVRRSSNTQPGPIGGRVLLSTEDPLQPLVSIPVHGTTLPSLRAQPGSMNLALDAPEGLLHVVAPEGSPSGGAKLLSHRFVEDDGGAPSLALTVDESIDAKKPLAVEQLRFHVPMALRENGLKSVGRGWVELRFDDPTTPLIRVRYRVHDREAKDVRQQQAKAAHVTLNPPNLYLRSYPVGSSETVQLGVGSLGGVLDLRDLRFVGVGSVTPRFELVREGRAARILLEVSPDGVGATYGRIVFRPRPENAEVEVPVEGWARSRIRVEPEGVFVEAARPTATLRLQRWDLEPLRITSAAAPVQGIATRVVPEPGGKRVRVEIDATEALRAGSLDTELELGLGLPGEDTVRVPLFSR